MFKPRSLTKRLLMSAIAAGCMASASLSSAAMISPIQTGDWQGGAYVSDETGRFTHCVAQTKYRNGLSLLFAVGENKSWSFGVADPKWDLTAGETHQIRYRIDKGRYVTGQAHVKTPTLLQISLPKEEALYNALSGGQNLFLQTGTRVTKLPLRSAASVLGELFECSISHTKHAGRSGSANGQTVSVNPEVSSPSVPNAQTRRESRTAVEILLKQAGIRAEFQDQRQQAGLHAKNDVVWKMANLVGSFRIIPDANLTGGEIAQRIRASDSRMCSGKFASGSVNTNGNSWDFTSACMEVAGDAKNPAMAVYYVILPRREGGHYLLTVIGHARDHENVAGVGEMLKGVAEGLNAKGSVPGARPVSG